MRLHLLKLFARHELLDSNLSVASLLTESQSESIKLIRDILHTPLLAIVPYVNTENRCCSFPSETVYYS